MDDLAGRAHATDVGARLRSVRELAGVSRNGVAHAAGIRKRELRAAERGRRQLTVDELRALAGALSVDPEVLDADGLGAFDRSLTDLDRIDAVLGHGPDRWQDLALAVAELPACLPVDMPDADRRRDLLTRRRIDDSWSAVRREMLDLIGVCTSVSASGSGAGIRDLVAALEHELARLATNREFLRSLDRHEGLIAGARGPAMSGNEVLAPVSA